MTRDEHLAWCKSRALAELNQPTRGGIAGAIGSMMSDLGKWEGGALYDDALLRTLYVDAIMFRRTPDDVRNWIEGFG